MAKRKAAAARLTKRKPVAAAKRRKKDDDPPTPEVVKFGEGVSNLITKIRSMHDEAKVKEVFLFELLCNANWALLRLRSDSLVTDIHGAQLPELSILISLDKINGSITIIDNGIGMNIHELQEYLCGIPDHPLVCYSETIKTYDTTSPDVDLSCFFSDDSYAKSLGFYSVYMVADKVVVTTKKTGGSQYVWSWEAESNGCDSCTIVEDTSGETQLGRGGTKVTVYLNKNHLKYVDDRVFNNLAKKCVKHLPCPVYLSVDQKKKKKKTKREIFYDEKKQREERAIPMETLKSKFEGLRNKFEEILGWRVEKVILSDRVPEFANNLSCDGKIFEINPRSPITEGMRQMLEDDRGCTYQEMKNLVEGHLEASLANIALYDMTYGTSYYHKPDLAKAMCLSSDDYFEGCGDEERTEAERRALVKSYMHK